MVASRNSRSPDLLQRVAAFVAARLPDEVGIALGLSGGCDSVVLLHLLVRLGFGKRLQVVHVHHGLSPHADDWADHCRALCRQLSVPLIVRRVDVERDSGLGLEAAARQARYAAFSEVAAPCLMLAQHRGDQSETVLFNLLRGAGVAGLAGMPPLRREAGQLILRPLLGEGRQDLEQYALAEGLAWVNDESNGDSRYSRNFLRHQVMPLLATRFPAVEQNLARTAMHCAEADLLLEEVASDDWALVCDGETARLRELCRLSPARIKNLLRYRFRLLGWRSPGTDRMNEFVRQLCEAGADRHPSLDLPDGALRASGRRLHWLSGKSQSVTGTLPAAQTHQLQSLD